jgi:hypothetical protein
MSHPVWSEQIGATIERTKAATASLGQALAAKDQAGAEAAAKALSDGAYIAQTAYYAYWLPTGVLANTAVQAGAQAAGAGGGHGDSHGAATASTTTANPGPNWLVIGGFGALMATVVASAWLLKRSLVAQGAQTEEPAAV